MVVNIVTSEICWTTGCRSSMLIDGVLRVWRYYIFSCISNAYEGVILQFVDTNCMLDTSYLRHFAATLYSGILFCTVHRNFFVTWLRTLLLLFIYLCDSEMDICQELVNLYLSKFSCCSYTQCPLLEGFNMYKLSKTYSRTFHSSHPTGLLLVSAYLCHNTWVELSISFVYSSNDCIGCWSSQALQLPVEMKEIIFVYSAIVLGDHYGRTWAGSVMPCVYTGTMESYLCAGATAVVLSDAIFDKSAMTNHDYTEISKRSAVATALASSIRRRLWENFPGKPNFLSRRKWWLICAKELFEDTWCQST